MDSVLEGGEHLERELTPEPLAAPAAGSWCCTLALAGCIVLMAFSADSFITTSGAIAGAGGAMQVNLVTNALPLPSRSAVNQNVLATETPSQAPAAAEPKDQAGSGRDGDSDPGQAGKAEHEERAARRNSISRQPKQENLAQYGEQAGSSMPRPMQPQGFDQRPDDGERRRLRQPFRLVRGPDQPQDGVRTGTSARWIRARRRARGCTS